MRSYSSIPWLLTTSSRIAKATSGPRRSATFTLASLHLILQVTWPWVFYRISDICSMSQYVVGEHATPRALFEAFLFLFLLNFWRRLLCVFCIGNLFGVVSLDTGVGAEDERADAEDMVSLAVLLDKAWSCCGTD